MSYKKLTLLALLFISLRAFPAVFVVTSNADSGPGTLRDALTQAAANGSAEKDYITFNLPGTNESDRTISISTQLPYLSSNLVIDGTTQPGNKLGRSDAKVIIEPAIKNTDTYSPLFNLFILLNVDGFELYGMSIRDFIGSTGGNNYTYFVGAMVVDGSTNIQIGAPGKGNVFAHNSYNIRTPVYSIADGTSVPGSGAGNLKVWSNFFGFEPDGKTPRGPCLGYIGGIDISACKGDIEIGGDDVADRNFFTNGAMYIEQRNTLRKNSFTSAILVKNNFFNYDIDGNPTAIPNLNASEVYAMNLAANNYAYTYDQVDYPYTVNIINNKLQYPYIVTSGFTTGDFTMQGNSLLFEPSVNHPAYSAGVGSFSRGNILIGGEQPGQANIIYGAEIDLFSRKSVLLQHNSIYCVSDFRGIYYPAVPYLDPPLPLPVVNISKVTSTNVGGTATPLSKIELFWDDDCFYCEPLTYVTTVNADANGNWQYNGSIQNGVVASAELNGFTSLFTKHAVVNGGRVTHYACGTGGNVRGMQFINTGGYQWKNSNNLVIGTDSVITSLSPGVYTLTALNGSCSKDYTFTIFDATPKINDSNKITIQPSCGNNTGSITGIYLDNYDVLNDAYSRGDYNAYTYKWIDAGGNTRSTSTDLNNVEAGIYRLEVSYKNQCIVIYGPITLKNTAGPNIDQSEVSIQSTNCGQSTGSIINLIITGTGSLKYRWLNSQQQQVGTDKDLLNQPSGSYKLQVTDDTQCGPVFTTEIIIPETNGITLDESKAQTTIASCSLDNGSVTGIHIIGATQYQWTDATGKAAGSDPDLKYVPSGDYTLTVSNNFGCTAISKPYHIAQQAPTQFPDYLSTTVPNCTGQSNGAVSVIVDGLVKTQRWVNSGGLTIGTGSGITNVAAGTYQLYLTDKNGCESFYKSYTVTTISQLQIVPGSEQITNDQCSLKKGSIGNVKITGGVPPYLYSWLDRNNNIVSSSLDISGLGEGGYTLKVSDNSACGIISAVYTIQNQNAVIIAPVVSNVQLCSAGDALLQVTNHSSVYSYRLYNSETSTTPIDEQTNGVFKITVKANAIFYVSQISGDCESSRTQVQVSVGLSSVDITNTFTPNGDGINDYWKITGIENYPDATIQIFNRYGQNVYESKGYPQPFDGKMNGKDLPVGVYYYIIKLNTKCNLISGSLTIIR